ncbi:hypothetical protein GE061_009686 [Apolygus lucorum]|uniref:C2H2-type domain-containing protein n=1 Tax=Apolygus lucorum TaxID=248454 RepID=A0A8S9Y2Z4_APOLU|nr:hypothetical protein GE061_009686 [Apolygus lucorum]
MVHTGEKPYACDICDFRSLQRNNLNVHRMGHITGKLYYCDSCKYRTGTRRDLNKHIKTMHISDELSNNLCDEDRRKRDPECPITSPTVNFCDAETYACDSCDFKTRTLNNLDCHLKIHRGDKPYFCDSCDFRTDRQQYLTVHRMSHTGETPYSCDSCEYITGARRNLIRHLRKEHNEQKPSRRLCDDDEAKRGLHRPKTSLTSDDCDARPFACDFCEFTSRTKSNLKRHLPIHTGEKPYACNICDFRSARLQNLQAHKTNKHATESPYSCDSCDYKTETQLGLKRHIRRSHRQ